MHVVVPHVTATVMGTSKQFSVPSQVLDKQSVSVQVNGVPRQLPPAPQVSS
jgi:hypothetical protein